MPEERNEETKHVEAAIRQRFYGHSRYFLQESTKRFKPIRSGADAVN